MVSQGSWFCFSGIQEVGIERNIYKVYQGSCARRKLHNSSSIVEPRHVDSVPGVCVWHWGSYHSHRQHGSDWVCPRILGSRCEHIRVSRQYLELLGQSCCRFFLRVFVKNYSFPRPLILTTVLAISCVGHLFIAFAIPGSLYVASIVIGFCFGAQWPVIFAIISELFGVKHYPTFYNLVGSVSPYDLEARKQQQSAMDLTVKASSPTSAPHRNELTCTGVSCLRETFIIMAIVSALGSVICGWLVMRTKDFYKGDIYAKYQTSGLM